jgi:predicted LPLAT superfamily acyltransferase
MSELPPTPRGSARTIAVVTVVVALIAGVMVGIVGDRVWLWRHRGRTRTMRAMTPRILARFDSELHLSPAQHQAVSAILERHRQRMSAIFDSVQPQIRGEIDSANAEIQKLLSPEQRTTFETMKLKVHGSGRQRRP